MIYTLGAKIILCGPIGGGSTLVLGGKITPDDPIDGEIPYPG